ncbi:MAG: hypothetical protein JWP32_2696 [Schumannella sp.]|nr:hypothetical protein [Schumannella sp.]
MNRVLAFGVFALMCAAMGWGGLWLFLGVMAACWAHLHQKLRERRSEAQRLIADADFQHAAWLKGNDVVAFFGRYLPNGVYRDLVDGPTQYDPDVAEVPEYMFQSPAPEGAESLPAHDEEGNEPIFLSPFSTAEPRSTRRIFQSDVVG